MKRKNPLIILKDAQLEKLPTKRLLGVLKSARAVRSCVYHYAGDRCCEICHEYMGSDEQWDKEVKPLLIPLDVYVDKIKSILNTRENIPKGNIR